MIDSLFGSRTRVKLLYLFLNNPSQSYYVREITRLIGEQINSVRRELLNMLKVGVILSESCENKLFYQVNPKYEHYESLKSIFTSKSTKKTKSKSTNKVDSKPSQNIMLYTPLKSIKGVRMAIATGKLVKKSSAGIDILIVGNESIKPKISSAIKKIESSSKKAINYSVMNYDEFYYRLSIRDKFISNILDGEFEVIIDDDGILSK